jgi:hypothetical protein
MTLLFFLKTNANSFAESWLKWQKIVIITSTPGYRMVVYFNGGREFQLSTFSAESFFGEWKIRRKFSSHIQARQT